MKTCLFPCRSLTIDAANLELVVVGQQPTISHSENFVF